MTMFSSDLLSSPDSEQTDWNQLIYKPADELGYTSPSYSSSAEAASPDLFDSIAGQNTSAPVAEPISYAQADVPQEYGPPAPTYDPSYDQQIYAPAPELSYTAPAELPQYQPQDLPQYGPQPLPFVAPDLPQFPVPYQPQDLPPEWQAQNEQDYNSGQPDIFGGDSGVVYNPLMPLDPSQVQDMRGVNQTGVSGGFQQGGLGALDNGSGVSPYELGQRFQNLLPNPQLPEQGGTYYSGGTPYDASLASPPVDPSTYAQFGFNGTGEGNQLTDQQVADLMFGRTTQPQFFDNPLYAAQNAQFDATTDPANRGGVGLLGGALNLGKAAITPYEPLADVAKFGANAVNNVISRQNQVSNPFALTNATDIGAQGGVGQPVLGDIAASLIPQSPLDVALTLPLVAGLKGLTPAETAMRGYGFNLDSLSRLGESPAAQVVRVAVQPGAVRPLVEDGLAASRGAVDVVDPYGVRILGPGDALLPGEVQMFHGTAGPLRGATLDVGTFLTPNIGDAEVFARQAQAFASTAKNTLPAFDARLPSVLDNPAFARDAGASQVVIPRTFPPEPASRLPAGIRVAGGAPDEIAKAAEQAVTAPEVAPIQKLTDAIKNAGKATPEQRAMFAAERAQRTAIGAATLEKNTGTEAFRKATGALGGEFARPSFTVPAITPDETHSLLETIRTSDNLRFYDKINAERAMQDLFNGRIPQPAQLTALKKAFPDEGNALVKAILDKRSLGAKVWDEMVGALGLPQAIKASFDISAPFRQGMVLGWSNPREWVKSWKPMLDSLTSEEGFARSIKAVEDNPWFSRADGLGFKDVGGHVYAADAFTAGLERAGGFAGLNDSYISRFVQNVPIVGTRRYERAFDAFLNEEGMTVYAKVAQNMWDAGVRDPQQFQALAKVLNHGRGYGDFSVGQIAQGVNAFFSGRNFVSRFQVLADPILQPGGLLNTSARQQAAKNLVGMVASNMTLLGFLGATGAATGMWSVEMDPRSTDWGKLRIGQTRIDPWAGFSPLARLVARIATGETKTSTGDLYPINAKDEVLRFLRNKAAPIPSFVIDHLVGENAIGQPTKAPNLSTLADMLTPFIAQDVYEAAQQSGLGAAAITGPASTVGLGTLSYPESMGALRDHAAQSGFNQRYRELPPFAQAQINKQLEDQGKPVSPEDKASPYISAGNGALMVAKQQLAGDAQLAAKEEQFLQGLEMQDYSISDYSSNYEAHTAFTEMARSHGASRVQAEGAWDDYANNLLGMDKLTRQMREDAIRADPSIVDALDKLYENGSEFSAPKWARELADELSRVR